MLKNSEGGRVPEVTFKTWVEGEWRDVTTQDLFGNRSVVAFALPGAFTPTCTAAHLPRYNDLATVFKESGIDAVLCISVNDAFVMNAWQRDQHADKVVMVPDGNGEFTQAMGMLVDKRDQGYGYRSWRYSMLVRDGLIEKMFIEPEVEGDPYEVSDADTMLAYVNPDLGKIEYITLFTREGCPYCARAKSMLREKGLPFEEIELNKDISHPAFIGIAGTDTVPQAFIGGRHIGGSEALENYLRERKG